jgi:hypothetical protein
MQLKIHKENLPAAENLENWRGKTGHRNGVFGQALITIFNAGCTSNNLLPADFSPCGV